jgi:hypothetical protein
MNRGGLFHRNGAGQEQFCWDIRSEPEVIKTFAKIWGTEELLVSVGTSSNICFSGDSPDSRLRQHLSAIQQRGHGRPRPALASCRSIPKQAIQALCSGYHEPSKFLPFGIDGADM